MSDFDDSVSAFAFISSQSSPASALGESTAAQVSSLGEFAIIATGSAYALASELQPPRATAQASSTFSVSFEITEPRSFFLDASIVAVEGDLAGAGEAEVRLLDQNGALLDENVFNADPFSPAVSQRSTLRGVLQPGVYSIQTAARAIVESVDPFDAESEATFDLLLTLCPADLTVDGQVGSADLQFILGNWLSDDPIADLDGNGVVSTGDLAIMLGSWGACR
ncbi:MAG: hypothetical protein VYC34_08535 [Planctomycetota bacterium]|nr:hypothetical protein [Planctomycetota bacterium]